MNQQAINKDRVQLSAEDLETLCTMLRDKIRDLRTPELEALNLAGVLNKLGRARTRILQSQQPKKDSGQDDPEFPCAKSAS